MQQRHWLELIKDYDLEILYHPGKANLVADALSCKKQVSSMPAVTSQKEILEDLRWLDIKVVVGDVEKRRFKAESFTLRRVVVRKLRW